MNSKHRSIHQIMSVIILGSCESVDIAISLRKYFEFVTDGQLFLQERDFLQEVKLPLLQLEFIPFFQFFPLEDM
jgi:hypothetical protein